MLDIEDQIEKSGNAYTETEQNMEASFTRTCRTPRDQYGNDTGTEIWRHSEELGVDIVIIQVGNDAGQESAEGEDGGQCTEVDPHEQRDLPIL